MPVFALLKRVFRRMLYLRRHVADPHRSKVSNASVGATYLFRFPASYCGVLSRENGGLWNYFSLAEVFFFFLPVSLSTIRVHCRRDAKLWAVLTI